MYRFAVTLFVVLVLVGCGSQPTAKDIAQQLANAGLPITDIRDGPPLNETPLPVTATSRVLFTIPGTTRAGQVFVCKTSVDCAEYVGYFTRTWLGVPTPYVYQSKAGTVVVVVSAESAPTIAQNVQAAVAQLP